MTPGHPSDRLAACLAEAEAAWRADPALAATGGRTVAVGWATVDLERAAAELGASLGFSPTDLADAASSEALGASARILRHGPLPGVALVLLEPDREGRLAATLARHDEGPLATWRLADDPEAVVAALQRAGIVASVEGIGPLGPERLLLDGPAHGPHRLLVGRAGTIDG